MDDLSLEIMSIKLLLPLWRGIDPELKASYRARIWEMFQAWITIAANQNSTLPRFISQICQSGQISVHDQALDTIRNVVKDVDQTLLLRYIRDNTPYIVILIRLQMQQIRESYQEE